MIIKSIFTASLILVSVTLTTASNLFGTFRGVESDDTKRGSVIPANKPSTNHSEKNANAKSMAKQLLKSVSANALLGKTSDVLERYGYNSSVKGTFFSNSNTVAVTSLKESFAIMSMSRSERGDVVRLKVESNKDLEVYFNAESGLEVPFGLMNLGKNEIFMSPTVVLPDGKYLIRLRTKENEVKLHLVVERGEFLGKK